MKVKPEHAFRAMPMALSLKSTPQYSLIPLL
jgi:hypothetical protein